MKIPVKKKDRGSVTIPCTIGDRKFKKALIDVGASVSLMPLSIYKKLGIGSVQDTQMTLQFADRSVRQPYGIVEDVLVKIDKFYVWDDPFLYKKGLDGLVRRCVPEEEQRDILKACHNSEYGGHFSRDKTAAKVLKS
ncbi:uncharacterized protein LOC127092332 [Lathyrus oleraceus]|uniref:uncharacterized protein LOC127092332 n=1 Tax=Pisum sativum TaxID=3888 RepID=UPI0021D074B1|nr:uncharacterized protein LOC127092332 [Pisum sativum]